MAVMLRKDQRRTDGRRGTSWEATPMLQMWASPGSERKLTERKVRSRLTGHGM